MSASKTRLTKSKPTEIVYTNYGKFNESNSDQYLYNQLSSEQPKGSAFFEKMFLSISEEHSSLKKKLLCANHALYVTKALGKAFMRRSNLEKLYFKKRTSFYLKKYNEQKNYCSKLYKKERKAYFDKINPQKVSGNKSFWKNTQSLFSENWKIRNKITLVNENENITSEEYLVSEELNNLLKIASKNLQINENPNLIDEQSDITDPIMKAVSKYKHHPSILLINSKLSSPESFSLK